MRYRVAFPVCVFLVCFAASASASWNLWAVDTATPETWGIEGRIFDQTGLLLEEGAFVQFIVDTEGDGLDDPMAFFGGDINAITTWLRNGADPADFCDDQLLTASNWDGTTEIGKDWGSMIAGPGEVLEYPFDPYAILNGTPGMEFGWRAWNLTEGEIETFRDRVDEEVWYTTGQELGSIPEWRVQDNLEFTGTIGWEVYMYENTGDPQYRSINQLDHHFATAPLTPFPEPGTCAIIGLGLAGLFWRSRKKANGGS